MFQKFHISNLMLMIALLSSQNTIGQNVIRLTTQIIAIQPSENIELTQTLSNSTSSVIAENAQPSEKRVSTSKIKFSKRKPEKSPDLSFRSNDELFLVKDNSLQLKSVLNSDRNFADLFLFASDIFSIRMTDSNLLEVLLTNGSTFLIDTETSFVVSLATSGNKPDSEFNLVNSHSSNYPKSTICCVQKDGSSTKNEKMKYQTTYDDVLVKVSAIDNLLLRISGNQNIWSAVIGRLYEKRSTCKTGDLNSSLALSTYDCLTFSLTTSIYFQQNPYFKDSQSYFIKKHERTT